MNITERVGDCEVYERRERKGREENEMDKINGKGGKGNDSYVLNECDLRCTRYNISRLLWCFLEGNYLSLS